MLEVDPQKISREVQCVMYVTLRKQFVKGWSQESFHKARLSIFIG